MLLNWLLAFRPNPAPAMPPRQPRRMAGRDLFDPVRAAFEAECG